MVGDDIENEDGVSPKMMRKYIQHEIDCSARMHELRSKELSEIMKACGPEISVDEASERYNKYLDRWGEVFPALAHPQMSDEEIVAKIDQKRKEQDHSARIERERNQLTRAR